MDLYVLYSVHARSNNVTNKKEVSIFQTKRKLKRQLEIRGFLLLVLN